MAMSLPGGFSSVAELLAEQRKRDERLRQVFDWIDTDGNGTIEYEEFLSALKQLDADAINEDDVKTQWEIIDSDGSNAMEFQEFKRLMTAAFDKNDAKSELQRVLSQKSLIGGGDGSVSIDVNKIENDNSSDVGTPRLGKKMVVPLSARSLKQHNKRRNEWENKLHKIFDAIDDDDSGTIELDELWNHISRLEKDKINLTYSQLKTEFEFYDTNNSKSINFDEFRKLMMVQYDNINTSNSNNTMENNSSINSDDDGNNTPRMQLQLAFSNTSESKKNDTNDNNSTMSFKFPDTTMVIDENSELNTTSIDESSDELKEMMDFKSTRRQPTVIRHLSMNSIDENKEDFEDDDYDYNSNSNSNSSRKNINNLNIKKKKEKKEMNIHTLTSVELMKYDCKEMSIYICKLFGHEKYKQIIIDNEINGTKFFQFTRNKWKKAGIKDRNDVTKILTAIRKSKTKK